MPVINDSPTPNSITLPLGVTICRHPSGTRWTPEMAGTYVELQLHLDPTGADDLQLRNGVVEVIRRALAEIGEDAGDMAFVDVRYRGDLTRGCSQDEDDEYIGDEMNRLLDAFFYKSRLYLASEHQERNNHPVLARHVRDALLAPMREAA